MDVHPYIFNSGFVTSQKYSDESFETYTRLSRDSYEYNILFIGQNYCAYQASFFAKFLKVKTLNEYCH